MGIERKGTDGCFFGALKFFWGVKPGGSETKESTNPTVTIYMSCASCSSPPYVFQGQLKHATQMTPETVIRAKRIAGMHFAVAHHNIYHCWYGGDETGGGLGLNPIIKLP